MRLSRVRRTSTLGGTGNKEHQGELEPKQDDVLDPTFCGIPSLR
jgi:hypothetical protein